MTSGVPKWYNFDVCGRPKMAPDSDYETCEVILM